MKNHKTLQKTLAVFGCAIAKRKKRLEVKAGIYNILINPNTRNNTMFNLLKGPKIKYVE